MRGEQAAGLVRRGVGDAAQVLDAGDAGTRGADRGRLSEVRCHGDAARTRLLHDGADERRRGSRV